MTSQEAKSAQVMTDHPKPRAPSWWRHLWQAILHRMWYVHSGMILTVDVSPMACLKLLQIAAKPSATRLHLRQVFSRGRRYFIQPHKAYRGFRMTTTNKVPWSSRQRTSSSAVLSVQFEPQTNGHTRLILRGRIKTFYFLDVLWLPLFVVSIIVFMPWHPAIIASLIALLFSLSWMAHRSNAALEVYEMLFFMEKALEGHIPPPPPMLASESGADMVYDGFAEAWTKFYAAHVQDEAPPHPERDGDDDSDAF